MSFPFISEKLKVQLSSISSPSIGVPNFDTAMAETVSKLRSQLEESNVTYDNLVLAFTESVDAIPDEEEEISESLIEITSDQYNNIDSTLKTLMPNIGDSIAITLDDGRIISVSRTEQQGETVFNTTSVNAQTPDTRALLAIIDGVPSVSGWIYTVDGGVVSTYDMIKQIAASSTLNDKIIQMCNVVTNPETAEITFGALVSSIATEDMSFSSKSFVKTCVNAYAVGGANGLGSQLVSLVRGMTNITGSHDTIGFTDASVYVPNDFLVGILDIAYTVVSVAVTAIVSIFNPILGAAVAGIAYIGKQIIDRVREESKEEYSYLNVNGVRLPFTPYPLYQFIGIRNGYELPVGHPDYSAEKMSISEGNVIYKTTITNGMPFVYFKTFGGYLYVGPREYDENGVICLWTLEFHPDLVDRRDYAGGILNELQQSQATITYLQQTSSKTARVKLAYDIPTSNLNTIRSRLIASANHVEPYPAFSADSEGEYAGYIHDDEAKMINIISANCFIWWMANNLNNYPETILDIDIPVAWNCSLSSLGLHGTYGPSTNVAWIWADTRSVGSYPYVINWSYEGQSATLSIGNNYLHYGTDPMKNIGLMVDYYNDCNTEYSEVGYGSRYRFGYTVCDAMNSAVSDDFYKPQSAPVYVTSNREYLLVTPKWSRGSVLRNVILGAIGLVATVAVVAFATVTIKRQLSQMRAISSAKVGQAWQNFQENPTAANYKLYRKTAKKNNRLASIIGGTKYDVDDYWFGDQYNSKSSNTTATSTDVSNIMYAIVGRNN